MDSEIPEAFQKELTCLVCLNFLLDPVTIGCGHSFCRSCLCLFWEQAEVPASCPVCRQPSEQTNLKTNFLLKNLVSTVRKANLRQFLKCEEHLCGTHRQKKMIFCEANKSLLCLVCSQGQEHKTHRHCSAEEAAEESWEKLAKQMRSLWEKIQETERNLKKSSRGTDPWMFYVYRHGDMIRRTYQMAPPFLPEEEDYYVESIVKEGQNIYNQLRRRQEEIIGKKRELQEIHKELIQMCSKSDVELLQELEDKLKWSETAQLHVPQPLLPELPARPMSGLMEWLNRFRVNFSLSNEVSSQHIRLFDDARRLTYEHDSLHASLDGGTLKYFASWGDQSFTSGKQYWEMLVDSSWDWAVGVCKDSWIRKDDGILDKSNRDNFLLVCVKQDDHYQLWTTAPTTPLYIERPLGRVGVFLDCDSGSISFVDVAKRTLLWRYNDGVCTFPVRPFFCTGHR
ncbi:tripartite motif-containing protein 43-like [Bubalus kerabau]|uniref:tripartite motif-containing protein 43-like n=1 Tax=Bubalus carabanensis TaxID=3119969 RepID=UPI00042D01DB|nr:tripartite motif-containing protein 43 isoform X1 [Bubalus bubalis]XP_044799341.1 tripartite motif-containing protein 43 isoform X1 [Bubalus bubalis]XP_055437564.1 tripartite motif-containing protein 43-like [Bubalus carabanensis]